MTAIPESPTVRKRIADILEDAHLSAAEIQRAVCTDGDEWVSYAYVGKIVRGADDVGPKAARVRTTIARLTGKSITELFSGVTNARRDAITVASEEAGGSVSGATPRNSGVDGEAP